MKQFRCSKKLVRKFYPWKCFSEILPSLTISLQKTLGKNNIMLNISEEKWYIVLQKETICIISLLFSYVKTANVIRYVL